MAGKDTTPEEAAMSKPTAGEVISLFRASLLSILEDADLEQAAACSLRRLRFDRTDERPDRFSSIRPFGSRLACHRIGRRRLSAIPSDS